VPALPRDAAAGRQQVATEKEERMTRVPVAVRAEDPILTAGVGQQLRQRPEVELLVPPEEGRAVVSLVVVDRVADPVVQVLNTLRMAGTTRVGLVVGTFDQHAFQTIVQCGVSAVLRRAEADPDRLAAMVTAIAKGDGVLPGDVLGRLLEQVGQLQRRVLDPRGLTMSTLSAREVEMLRLIADGLETAEIAEKMAYSERTVKNLLYELTTRLHLRNRAHAVGYALRNGLI
jgi:DNA-binding NarL/FixJ family response regulator